LVLVALVAAVLVPGGPAGADAISDKRAEAERIARQIDQQSRQLAILAEDYDEARVRVTSIETELKSAKTKLAETDADAAEVRGRLKDQAVASYVRGGAMPTIALLAETKMTEDIGVRTQYVRTVTAGAADVLDELRAVRLQLDEQRDRLAAAEGEAKDAAALAEQKRREASKAQAAQQRTLEQVQGELSDLVEAEAKRRAEEEARRVQAELAAKAAKAKAEADAKAARDASAARQKATTTTTGAAAPAGTVRRTTTTTTAPKPTSGSTGGGSTGGDSGSSAGPPAAGADAAIAEARRQIGKPYEYGGSGPDSFDCSGLTSWAWRAGGKSLSHSSRAQWSETSRVSMSDIQPGDLVFYGSPIHHVGLYIGGGQMIEAPETGKNVRYASIYRSDLVGAGRVN
jgi:cell wall-associated NlpC family hydrolase